MSIAADSGRKVDTLMMAKGAMLVPPLAALFYPFFLEGFHASAIRIAGSGISIVPWLSAALCLALAFATPLIAILAAMFFSEVARPTVAQIRAVRAALLAVAAPTLFTFVGVVLIMLHNPLPDTWLWIACWSVALVWLLRSDDGAAVVAADRRPVPVPLRVAHGVSALTLVIIFLALHIANHLMFPAGESSYAAMMNVFRRVYRNEILQPLIVALFLFQIGTGMFFVWRLTAAPRDRFRTFQIASGVYLALYVPGHMNSVFIFARTYLGIDTGWGFATGAPGGLVKDGWNIRLVPHYWFGAFFVLAHLAAGGRRIIMAHGVSGAIANRVMIGGTVVGGLVATVILLGMCGMRIQWV